MKDEAEKSGLFGQKGVVQKLPPSDPLSRAPTPLCVPEGPLRARIRGTRTHMGSREAGEVGRQLINLVTGTVLRMENRGRKTGTLLL